MAAAKAAMNSADARSNSAEAVTRLALAPERGLQVAGEIGAAELHVDALGALEQGELAVLPVRPVRPGGQPLGRGVEQRLLVVDQGPVLLRPQQRRGRAQVGARAAAQVHDRDGAPAVEVLGQRVLQLAVARAVVRRLAPIEPLRRKACPDASHWATSSMTPAMMRAVSSQRGSFWPAAQEASAMRRRRPVSCKTPLDGKR